MMLIKNDVFKHFFNGWCRKIFTLHQYIEGPANNGSKFEELLKYDYNIYLSLDGAAVAIKLLVVYNVLKN